MESSDPPCLSSFKVFQRFHCFYYTRINDKTYFLLFKKKNNTFSHFQGKLNELDPAILFSLGRKLVKISSGLLIKRNLLLFADDTIHLESLMDIVELCKPQLQTVTSSFALLFYSYCSLAKNEPKSIISKLYRSSF